MTSKRHPYVDLPNERFWNRSVAAVPLSEFDPCSPPRFHIGTTSRIATAGSCFAQHISKWLTRSGYRFYVTEDGAGIPHEWAQARQYGLYSARYGNIYTVRQLFQLVAEAFGRRAPAEIAWRRSDGRYVDAFRPQVEPDGYAGIETVLEARLEHLAAVRQLFENADVLIFTLGLTEAWESVEDGSAYPLSPGVAAGVFDTSQHRFVNYTVAEIASDLDGLFGMLRQVNAGLSVILTVSPVPLAATYEDRNVLLSTTYSKSVLRVAAQMARDKWDWVDYFPSYEVVTGPQTRGVYFDNDLRNINAAGVNHAMRLFARHYLESAVTPEAAKVRHEDVPNLVGSDLICDENLLAED